MGGEKGGVEITNVNWLSYLWISYTQVFEQGVLEMQWEQITNLSWL